MWACALQMVIFGKQQCPFFMTEAPFVSALCCLVAEFISWQLLYSVACWRLKGTVAGCWPRCLTQQIDLGCGLSLSRRCTDLQHQTGFPPCLIAEKWDVASCLGSGSLAKLCGEIGASFAVHSDQLVSVAQTTGFHWRCCVFVPKDQLFSARLVLFHHSRWKHLILH